MPPKKRAASSSDSDSGPEDRAPVKKVFEQIFFFTFKHIEALSGIFTYLIRMAT